MGADTSVPALFKKEEQEMNKKAFFFDIDETLYSWVTHQVPDSAVYALERLREQGHLTFINSGRMFSTVSDFVKTLPVTGFICGCGTQIISQNNTLLLKRVSKERIEEINRVIWENNGDIIWEGEDDCYFSEKVSRFDIYEKTRQGFSELGFGTKIFLETGIFPASKFCFYADEKSDIDSIKKELSKDMEIMDRGIFYEVSPKECSKASGIDFVLTHYQVAKEESYVFGDSSNDLSMFKAVKHAIAMGKHDPILDPYTEFVTKTVEEDGILYALQQYGIL